MSLILFLFPCKTQLWVLLSIPTFTILNLFLHLLIAQSFHSLSVQNLLISACLWSLFPCSNLTLSVISGIISSVCKSHIQTQAYLPFRKDLLLLPLIFLLLTLLLFKTSLSQFPIHSTLHCQLTCFYFAFSLLLSQVTVGLLLPVSRKLTTSANTLLNQATPLTDTGLVFQDGDY